MTLERAQKNLRAMSAINTLLVKVGTKKSKKILSMLLQAYADDKDIKDEIVVMNQCIKKLDELDHSEIEATLKYLIDLHVRAEFEVDTIVDGERIMGEDQGKSDDIPWSIPDCEERALA